MTGEITKCSCGERLFGKIFRPIGMDFSWSSEILDSLFETACDNLGGLSKTEEFKLRSECVFWGPEDWGLLTLRGLVLST
jgi:hypothetical protein